MYTQCPDCSTAFRVTAEVLKQAAGKVRCGGCGNAFNALEYLSENMPEQPAAKAHDKLFPQLTAEPSQTDERVPAPISDDQNAALLKTLDKLAGSDVRIEDTGVEWRVLDNDEATKAAAGDDAENISNIDDSALDELLEDSPMSVEELRFDDNTPLPDEFNLDDEIADKPESPDFDPFEAEADSGFDHEPVDTALSDPGEWADILDEVDEPSPADGTPHGAEELLDVDTQFALQAEAMGLEFSGTHRTSEDVAEEPVHEASDEEVALGPELEDEAAGAPNDHIDAEEDVEEEQAQLLFGSVDTAMAPSTQQ
jgi:predicted Zn finger-like uncharacterized protein